MTTARSSFSVGRFWPVYRNTLRRFRSSGIFYGILGFLFLPLQYILYIAERFSRGVLPEVFWSGMVGLGECYTGFSVFFFSALTLVMPLTLAGNIYAYMQNKRAVDVYHSLPLTRAELFFANAAAGVTLMWIPIAVNFAVVAAAGAVTGCNAPIGMILLEMLCWMAVTLAIFAVTAFAAVQVGTVFDTAIFSLVLNGSLSAVYLFVVLMANAFLYGFVSGDEIMEIACRLSPVSVNLLRLVYSETDAGLVTTNITVAIWFAAGLALLAAGAWLYGRRKSEQAEQVGNLGPLQIYVRAVGTLLAGTLIGAAFFAVLNLSEENRILLLLCIAGGSLIAYFIGDVILTRTYRKVWRAMPAALATAAAVCVVNGVIMYDATGFETRVPDAGDVLSVEFDGYYGRYEDGPKPRHYGGNNTVLLADPAAIDIMVRAHQATVDEYKGKVEPDANHYLANHGYIELTYQLRSGGKMRRQYTIYPRMASVLNELDAAPEFLEQIHPVFYADAGMLRSVSLYNANGGRTETPELTREQKGQLISALQNDLRGQPFSELQSGAKALGFIELELLSDEFAKSVVEMTVVQRGSDYPMVAAAETIGDEIRSFAAEIQITESYTETIALLRLLGLSDLLQNDLSEIQKAYIGLGDDVLYGTGVGGGVMQTDLSGAYNLTHEVYIEPAEQYEYEEDVEATAEGAFHELDLAELRALWPQLASVKVWDGPMAIVAVSASDEEEITGYYYIPVSALSDELRQDVIRRGIERFSDYLLARAGFPYEVVDNGPEIILQAR